MSEIRTVDDDIHSGVLHTESGDDGGEEPVSPELKSNKADGQTPGEMLREARLAGGYSVADLCAQTMLSKRTIEALEDNRFDQLSQPVFARGYYRKCAKILDMDTDALMAAYAASGGAQAAMSAEAATTPLHIVPADVTPDRRRTFGTIFLILILIVAAFAVYLFWAENRGTVAIGGNDGSGIDLTAEFAIPDMSAGQDAAAPSLAAAMSNQAAASRPQEPADAAPAAPAADAAGSEQTTAAAAGNQATLPDNPDAQAAADVAATSEAAGDGTPATAAPDAAPAAAGATTLTLAFNDRSWVDVRDATGRQLLVGIYESTTRTLDGVPPYELVIGYAPGVEVRFGGKPVEFKMEDNNTARFSVGKDGP